MKLKNNKGFHGPTFRVYTCPNCGKSRLYKEEGFPVSDRKVWSLDKTKMRYLDVCNYCLRKYAEEDQIIYKQKQEKAKEAIEKGENLPEGVSLEDGLA